MWGFSFVLLFYASLGREHVYFCPNNFFFSCMIFPEPVLHIGSFRRWDNTQSGIGCIVQENFESFPRQKMFPGYRCLASFTRVSGTMSWPVWLLSISTVDLSNHLHIFQGGVDDAGAASVRAIMHWQYRTISRGMNSILLNLYNIMGPKSHDYISFYGLRAHGELFDEGPVVTSQVLPYWIYFSIMVTRYFISLVDIALLFWPFSHRSMCIVKSW